MDSAVEERRIADRLKRRNEMPLSQRWYKARQQHISKSQKKALRELWPIYGIDLKFNKTIDIHLNDFFNKRNTSTYIVLDIGFGNGESTCGMAGMSTNTDKLFIGCEIYRAGLANALLTITAPLAHHHNETEHCISAAAIDNIRLIRADVTILFESHLSENSLNEICVFFPDPWPNSERDLQRRVIRLHMLDLFAKTLKPSGLLRIATDAEEYAQHVKSTVLLWNENQHLSLQTTNRDGNESVTCQQWQLVNELNHPAGLNGPSYRPVTHYERKAAEAGRPVVDLEYRLTES